MSPRQHQAHRGVDSFSLDQTANMTTASTTTCAMQIRGKSVLDRSVTRPPGKSAPPPSGPCAAATAWVLLGHPRRRAYTAGAIIPSSRSANSQGTCAMATPDHACTLREIGESFARQAEGQDGRGSGKLTLLVRADRSLNALGPILPPTQGGCRRPARRTSSPARRAARSGCWWAAIVRLSARSATPSGCNGRCVAFAGGAKLRRQRVVISTLQGAAWVTSRQP